MSIKVPNFKRTKVSWAEDNAKQLSSMPDSEINTKLDFDILSVELKPYKVNIKSKPLEDVLCIGLDHQVFPLPESWLYVRITQFEHLLPILNEQRWKHIMLFSDSTSRSTQLGLHLIQALDETNLPELTFIRSETSYYDAGLLGLAKTARLEFPNLKLSTVSCSASQIDTALKLVGLGDREQDFQINHQDAVCVPKLSIATQKSNPFGIDIDAAYVISGGAGELGLAAAETLVELGATHLVLINRSDYSHKLPLELQQLQRVANVHLIQTDINNGFQLSKVFRELRENGLPSVAGVIHTAGILTDGILTNQTDDLFDNSFDVKVNGAINLREAVQPTAFFINYSSLASIFGSPAQGSYAAANSALDQLTISWSDTGMLAQSIQWGVWASGGMAVRSNAVSRTEKMGFGSLSRSEGKSKLREILTQYNSGVYTVSPFDWQQLKSKVPIIDNFMKVSNPDDANNLPVSDVSFRKKIREAVFEAIGEIIEDHQLLMENGLNSLGSMSLRNRISMDLNVTLPSAFVVECPDINSMVRYVVSQKSTMGLLDVKQKTVSESDLPVLVIGAGIGGLGFARQLEQADITVQVVEKSESVGGVWVRHANIDSKLQIDSPAYDFDATQLPLADNHSWGASFPAQPKILSDSEQVARQLKTPILFNTEVRSVTKLEDQKYRIILVNNGVEKECLYSGVVAMTGGLHQPKRLIFRGEQDFQGTVAYGIGNDVHRSAFKDANVVIVGHGAFALENMRTALENGAKHVTILCRRRNLVMSTFCNWLLNTAPGVMTVSDVQEVMRSFYESTGVNIEDLPSFIKNVSGELLLDQTTVPPGSDLFFLAQASGKLSVVVDEIESVGATKVRTKLGKDISTNVLLKCLGFETESNLIPDIFGNETSIEGLWINGDRNLFTYNDGAQVPRKVKTLLCSSYAFFVQVFAKSYIYFRTNSEQFENALRRITKDQKGSTIEERIFMELWDFIEPAKKITAQRTEEQLPFDRFIVEREMEWRYYSEMLGVPSMASELWKLLKPVRNILARRAPNSPIENRFVTEKFGDFSVFTPQRKRVLFLPGQGTNASLARSLLERTGWLNRADLEFTIPDAPFQLPAFTNKEQLSQVGLDGLVELGVYDKNAIYREWRAGFETLWAEHHGQENHEDQLAHRRDWNFSLGYLSDILEKYGPFDGVAGFCEGAAVITTALNQEKLGANHGLSDIKFFIAMSPWQPPLFKKDGLFDKDYALDLPVLQIVGDNDMPVFIEAAPEFAKSYSNLINYHHPGQHVYPAFNSTLSSKVDELLFLSDQYESKGRKKA